MTTSRFWSEHDMMVWAWSPQASTARSKVRLRSSTVIEKNSPCLPEMNRPRMPRSRVQWWMLWRKPSSSRRRSSVNGNRAAAQMPVIVALAWALASLRV